MKKRLFIISVLAIAMVACLGSCKKQTVEPTSNSTSEPTTFDSICHHTSLVHVMAVEPTGEENGCIEHYLCPDCQVAFADAQGTMPIDNPILWATNYVIEDFSGVENYLSQFDSGEHGYMYDICLGTITGPSEEGSLWPDYTGWENWTAEQWHDYWECMYQYYIEWGGTESFDISNDLDDPFALFISNSLPKTLEIIDQIIQLFITDEQGQLIQQINEKLDKIMLKLENIQKSLLEISNKMTLQVYKDRMQARYERQVPLGNATTPYLREIVQLVAKEGGKYSQCTAETKAKIQTLAEEWHDQIVNGNNIETEFKNMLDFFKGDFSTGSSMPVVYDYIAAHSFEWEHKGYAFREMARAVDAVLMAECNVMNILYYKTHTSQQFLQFKPIKCSMMSYAFTLNQAKIQRDDNCLVCQIPGAKVKVKKKMKYLNCREYLDRIGDTEIYLKNEEHVEAWRKWLFPNGTVSVTWPRTVCSYYANKYPSEAGKENFFYDQLLKLGFTDIDQSHSWAIVTDCDCKWHEVTEQEEPNPDERTYNYIIRMFRYHSALTGNGDYLGYHTTINRKNGTLGWGQAITSMRIKNGTHRIAEKGSHIYVSYYAIELSK